MGFSLFVSFERDIPEIQGWDMCGKTLARNIEELDKIAGKLGLELLGNMVSISKEDVEGLLDEEFAEEIEPPPKAGKTKKPPKGKKTPLPENIDDLVEEIEEEFASIEEDLKKADAEGVLDEKWYPSASGLKTVRGLVAHVRGNPKKFKQSSALLKDLEEVERYLAMADKEGVRFHLTPDF